MIGCLPQEVIIDGVNYEIRSDYRDILKIFEVFSDEDMSDTEKWITTCLIFYKGNVPKDAEKAAQSMIWFINMGDMDEQKEPPKKPVYDWEQDEQMIFSAVNNVAGKEIRSEEYMHWWSFMGYFSAIGESTFSTVVNIRSKKNEHKKLEKYEQEFYKKNKKIVDIKKHYSQEQIDEMNKLNNLLGG